MKTKIYLAMDDEHLAMLDAICSYVGRSRAEAVRELLYSLLEDDAAAQGCYLTADGRVVFPVHWGEQ